MSEPLHAGAPRGSASSSFDEDLLGLLACPRDHRRLRLEADALRCELDHRWPVVDGIPIFLLPDRLPTHPAAERSLAVAEGRAALRSPEVAAGPGAIDSFVQGEVAATNGNLYRGLIGRLSRYPIPCLPMEDGAGRRWVELGCNWGRWCLAAARAGWRPLGIDPSLEAVLAARRVARQLGLEADFVVGDARWLPLRPASVEAVFSYSVLQHLSRHRARAALEEAGRVLIPGGRALVQLPNRCGLRSASVLALRLGRPARGFEVRYWSLAEMRQAMEAAVGCVRLRADGFLSLNPRPEDADLLPLGPRMLVRLSERLRRASSRVPGLLRLADSVWVEARRASGG